MGQTIAKKISEVFNGELANVSLEINSTTLDQSIDNIDAAITELIA
jgi:hypothetical protein